MDVTLGQPIQRFGVWWARAEDGSWLRHDAASGKWEPTSSSPPPPPPPPIAGSPHGTSVEVAGEPLREIGLSDDTLEAPKQTPEWLEYFRSRAISMSIGVAVIFTLLVFAGLRPASSGVDASSAFVPLTGYEYDQVPDDQIEAVRTLIRSDPSTSDYVRDLDARAITKKGVTAAMAFVIAVDPTQLDSMDRSALLVGFESAAGSILKTKRIKGFEGYEARVAGTQVILFIDPTGYLVEVVGPAGRSVGDIAKQLATGASARAATN